MTSFREAFPAVAAYADQLPYDRAAIRDRALAAEARLAKEHTAQSAIDAAKQLASGGQRWTKAEAVAILASQEVDDSTLGQIVKQREAAAVESIQPFAEWLYTYGSAAYSLRSAVHNLAESVEGAKNAVANGRSIHSAYTMGGELARLAEYNGKLEILTEQGFPLCRGVQALYDFAQAVRKGERPSSYFALRHAVEILEAEDAAKAAEFLAAKEEVSV